MTTSACAIHSLSNSDRGGNSYHLGDNARALRQADARQCAAIRLLQVGASYRGASAGRRQRRGGCECICSRCPRDCYHRTSLTQAKASKKCRRRRQKRMRRSRVKKRQRMCCRQIRQALRRLSIAFSRSIHHHDCDYYPRQPCELLSSLVQCYKVQSAFVSL